MSPSLDKEAIVVKQFSRQWLGEVVGSLVAGVDFVDLKLLCMFPKPVPFVEKVPSAVSDPVIHSKVICSLVVLKDSSAYSSAELRRNIQGLECFTESTFDWKQDSQSVGESSVFSLKGGAGNG